MLARRYEQTVGNQAVYEQKSSTNEESAAICEYMASDAGVRSTEQLTFSKARRKLGSGGMERVLARRYEQTVGNQDVYEQKSGTNEMRAAICEYTASDAGVRSTEQLTFSKARRKLSSGGMERVLARRDMPALADQDVYE